MNYSRGNHEEEHCLWVSQGFPELRPFPLVVDRDSLVVLHTCKRNFLLPGAQPARIGLVVGQKICENEAECKTKCPKE